MAHHRSARREVPHGGPPRPPDVDPTLTPLTSEEAPPSPFTPTAAARRLWGALLLKVARARIQEKTL